MPIGEYEKTKVRELARSFGLYTADKKDSQGICFIGKVGIKEFLLTELGPQPSGPIIDQHGRHLGVHDGAIFYTIGQRHGLQIGGGLPYYVTGKDMERNTIYVTTDLQDHQLWKRELTIGDAFWINREPSKKQKLTVRIRYRAPLITVVDLQKSTDTTWQVHFNEEVRAVTAGQSAVLYDGDAVLGGGIVA